MSAVPKSITNRRGSRVLEIAWPDGRTDQLPWEYLRVHSPSAEVQGHGQPRVIPGKRDVVLKTVAPVGRYAVKLGFDDGHDTGLFTWELLAELARDHDTRWQQYLESLEALGMSRDSDVVKLAALTPKKYDPRK